MMLNTLDSHQLIIYQEMMSHPALFTHGNPQKVVILGEKQALIAQEVLKHSNIAEVWQTVVPAKCHDSRIKLLSNTDNKEDSFDIIILSGEDDLAPLANYYALLRAGGILLYPSTSPFELAKLKSHHQELTTVGFHTIQALNFPQFDRPTGWRTVFMAIKNTPFKHVYEKKVFDRSFTTQYYNFDIHKAALVLPEFMREELPA